MKQVQKIEPKLNHSINSGMVTLTKDQWLGVCLDDYLFKLCGTDRVVWLPKSAVKPSPCCDHAFEVYIAYEDKYCCARILITNSIRMCLVDQQQIIGSQLLAYFNNE